MFGLINVHNNTSSLNSRTSARALVFSAQRARVACTGVRKRRTRETMCDRGVCYHFVRTHYRSESRKRVHAENGRVSSLVPCRLFIVRPMWIHTCRAAWRVAPPRLPQGSPHIATFSSSFFPIARHYYTVCIINRYSAGQIQNMCPM